MRRRDREVLKIDEILEIIKKCDVCRLALFDEEYPYIIPMNFGFEYQNQQIIIYLHCANEGKKLDIIKQNNKVSFEMDCSHKLIQGSAPCDCTMEYESVIGNGRIEIMHENKEQALTSLMKHYSNEESFNFSDKMLQATTTLKITVEKITAKHLEK
ncbi:MAG: pyridoxamine 5'-phosphate oxidase family protein [Ruminiclostridium sp.]